ncbi:AfsR/SARP family transcriptional regulator [Streptomyces sp. NPDC047737]|uniref:AfsR/SARP family transcriptional regulator n=1 Tax=unclassified Streptomyces TaxID=2593676 RepID=UPI0033FE910D
MRFTVLGSVGAVVNEQFTAIAGTQQRILLATLLLRAGRLVQSEQLYTELWGDNPPDGVSNALQAHVSRLRRTLRRLGEEGPQPAPSLNIHASGYILDLCPDRVDINVFRDRIARARVAMVDAPMRARSLLDSALSLWQGDPLHDVSSSPMCRSVSLELDEEYLAALECKYELGLRCNEPHSVISELRRMSVTHPWRERLTELLMLALYRCGRQADAMEAYNAARARLVDELGIEPSPQLKRLFRDILNQEPALNPAPQPINLAS